MGSCTGADTSSSSLYYFYWPRSFNLFFLSMPDISATANGAFMKFFGVDSYEATSLLNSFSNAFNLPAVYSYQLASYLKSSVYFDILNSHLTMPKKCFDPSTQSFTTCLLTDWQCEVSWKNFKLFYDFLIWLF